jgi:zinc protease
LGGAFNSRINLDLREVHGYTYGAESGFEWRRVPEPSTFVVSTNVDTPKTDSAVVDMIKDIRAYVAEQPVVDSELAFAKRTATLALPLAFATNRGVAGAAGNVLDYHLPLDYYDHLSANYQAVTVGEARAAAARAIDPERLVIVVEGDRRAIEGPLRAAGIAPVVVVDDVARGP